MKLHVIETIRQLVLEEEEGLALRAHDFEHQIAMLYGEDSDEEAEDREASATETSPAARDAAKYEH